MKISLTRSGALLMPEDIWFWMLSSDSSGMSKILEGPILQEASGAQCPLSLSVKSRWQIHVWRAQQPGAAVVYGVSAISCWPRD